MRTDEEAFERVSQSLEYFKGDKGFMASLKDADLRMTSTHVDPADPTLSTIHFTFTVSESMLNGFGSLHGGCVATLFDICTSLNIIAVSREGFWDKGHVSRNLNCTYLRPAPLGSKVHLEAKTIHLGRTMCLLQGIMRVGGAHGKVCYTCDHGKARVDGAKL